ncbi:WD repeat protein, putative [Trichomonas vaginalis G3]|uniref:WD40 repeat-containing protein SMU1 n=1 Tax=Trichomonas vaginalis (strain ATCC PRA-98 / G3) TaxID=412133 RepID=A2G2R6_TRIV3|nr:repeat protein-related family [Trichomonas vaginalis G3]EAX88544.1 WD repeat protein, putative [Trichomonas vaginalis G3]KAI5521694.1 repeat protein-related family [Trichomonas vaginalis G3]|eukprot:XP_001301474.1 WD repeat protein [Trichomonas vaginalis G3]
MSGDRVNRPDLNVALDPNNPHIKNEILSAIVQHLEESGLIASSLILRDEMRLKISKDSARSRLLLKLRVAIKSGDWNQIEPLTAELTSSPKLLYSILRHRFFELLSTGDTTTAMQFLATRLKEHRAYEDTPHDFEHLCAVLVDAASPSQSPQLPELSESLKRIIETIDEQIRQSDAPVIEKELPEHRLLDLLQLAVRFQVDDFKLKSPIQTLTSDFQPDVMPHGQCIELPSHHTASVKSIAFVPGTSTLLSGSSDKSVIVWSLAKMDKVNELRGHKGRIWSIATGNDVAATACSDGVVRVFNVPESRLIGEFHGHSGDVYSVDTDFEGRHIVSGGYDQSIIVWDAPTQAPETTLKGHGGAVTSVIFNSTGNIVVSGGKDLTVQLWDVRSYLATMQLAPVLGEVAGLSADPSFTRVLAATKDSTNRIWDLRMPNQVMLLKGHQNSAKHFVRAHFGPTGSTVIGGSDDGKIYTWDANTGKVIDKIRANRSCVFDVVWSSHAHMFASCGDEEKIRLWEPKEL